MMDERLGSLAQEFKDLVYPADYNPEGKTAVKRKPGEIDYQNLSTKTKTQGAFPHFSTERTHLFILNEVKSS